MLAMQCFNILTHFPFTATLLTLSPIFQMKEINLEALSDLLKS